jgi:hypothetical protein
VCLHAKGAVALQRLSLGLHATGSVGLKCSFLAVGNNHGARMVATNGRLAAIATAIAYLAIVTAKHHAICRYDICSTVASAGCCRKA